MDGRLSFHPNIRPTVPFLLAKPAPSDTIFWPTERSFLTMNNNDMHPPFSFGHNFTMEEAIAYVINVDLTVLPDQMEGLFVYLEEMYEQTESDYSLAKERGAPVDQLERQKAKHVESAEKMKLAQSLDVELVHEIEKIRQGKESILLIATDSMPGYHKVEFTKHSVFEWADKKYKIPSPTSNTPKQTNHPRRIHNTPLIEVLDRAIEEHWENHDPKRPPTKEAIKTWMEQQYPDLCADKSHGLSDKTIDIMCKIMRPPSDR